MHIKAPEIAGECKPGQFLMIQCGDDVLLRRPLSVHDIIKPDEIHLLYATPNTMNNTLLDKSNGSLKIKQVRDKGTLWLSELKSGSRIDILGPMGNYYQINQSAHNILLVAGGIGIAPLKFLARSALTQNKSVTMLIGARHMEGLYPEEQLPAGAKITPVIENGNTHNKYKTGMVTDILTQYMNWADQVFACGPQAMYEEIARQLVTWPEEKPVQISLEIRMGCGFGICYGCSIKTRFGMKRVCKEGPVFNIKDIIWQEVKL